MLSAKDIAGALGKATRAGKGWLCLCPAHDDHDPSLHVSEKDGRIFVKCYAGCTKESIIEALKARGLWPESFKTLSWLPPGIRQTRNGKRAVNYWTYRNEEGKAIGYVVRYEGDGKKEIIPFFKRDGENWKAGTADKPRPLYNLHKITQSSEKTIIVCEGEKAADAAQRLLQNKYITTTSLGGSKNYHTANWKPLKGRNVVLWPDADKPGVEYAMGVIQELHKVEAKIDGIVDFEALGFKFGSGKDAADIAKLDNLHLISVEEFKRRYRQNNYLIHNAEPEPETDNSFFTRKPFPLYVFPEKLQECLANLAHAFGVPVDILPGVVFCSIGAAVGRTVTVSPKESWRSPLIFWVGIIGESGQGKTPATQALVRPLFEQQKKEIERAKKALEEWESLPKKEREKTRRPPSAIARIVTDLTLEGIRKHVEAGHGGILCIQDELSAIITGLNQYKKGRGNDREAWLKLWDGSFANVVRVSETTFIAGARLSLFGGIQPVAFKTAFNDLLRRDGTLYRYLLTVLPVAHYEIDDTPWEPRYQEMWKQTLFAAINWANGQDPDKPHVMIFNKEAREAFLEWRNNLDIQKPDMPQILRGFIPKAVEYAVRLTGVIRLLHDFVGGNNPSRVLSFTDFDRACEVIEFYLAQAELATKLFNDDNTPITEVSERTIHLARILRELRSELDSGRLAIGFIHEQYNATCPDYLKIKTPRGMGALLRSCGLKTSAGLHDANGRHRVRCMVWDEKVNDFINRHLEHLERLESQYLSGLTARDIENATSRMSRKSEINNPQTETSETYENQRLALQNRMVEVERDMRDVRDVNLHTYTKITSDDWVEGYVLDD